MRPYYQNEDARLYLSDCREAMAAMDAGSVDSIVTDPPYGLSFMGKGWDHGVPGVPFWTEALRVAKPGAHLLAFGGTRTFHRLAVAIDDAGWEIRDTVMWVYGSGFPKSLDVSKATERGVIVQRDKPATESAKQWSGWGTALKPAWEPIIVARKPLSGTVAENVQEHGTGAINVDGCRVGTEERINPNCGARGHTTAMKWGSDGRGSTTATGRFPANLIHDGSDEVVGLFPETGAYTASMRGDLHGSVYGGGKGPSGPDSLRGHDDAGGSAARFFYCAKADRADRTEGGQVKNRHPTVKPTDLMRYLCRLVTPSGGVVLDPFMGSGSTGKAALMEGFRFVGIEKEEESIRTARDRIRLGQASQRRMTL